MATKQATCDAMYDVYLYSRIIQEWRRIQACGSLDIAHVIAARYRQGAYSHDPAWCQIRQGDNVIWDSLRD